MLRKALAVVVLGLLAIPLASAASDLDERWGIGLEGGLQKLVWGQHDYSNVDGYAGFRLRHGVSSHWTFELALQYGYIRPGVEQPDESAGITFKSGQAFYTTMIMPTLGAHYRFRPDSGFTPYIGASAGVMDWKVRDERGNENVKLSPDGPVLDGYDTEGRAQPLKATNITVAAVLGFEWFIANSFSLDFGGRYTQIIANDVDNVGMSNDDIWGPAAVDANTALVQAFVGLNLYFGSSDSDGDGIANANDVCPDDPEDLDGFEDMDGCPDPDNDGDGIIDPQDDCPDEAEDMDGFQDEDGCPDPDNDGDGIIDAQDDCPDEAEDMDGFQDEDGCPDPDNDGDGVLDAQDECPDTPAGVEVDGVGCPTAQVITATLILEGVNFSSGKADLTAASRAILDDVASSLRAYPDVRVEIAGHTDSTGGAELNRNISQLRAESVMVYLIEQGIDETRMVAVGYGEDQPIASNATPNGRAQNRRVELNRLN